MRKCIFAYESINAINAMKSLVFCFFREYLNLGDARILNIFEGAAEIQAHIVARRILEGGN